MKSRSVLVYTILRLLTFFVPLGVLLAVGIEGWIAALVSAVFGLAFSYVFLRRPREQVSTALYEARHPQGPVAQPDEDSEDAALDRFEAEAASAPAAADSGHEGGEGEAQSDAHDEGDETGQLERKDQLG